jgi:hypothetical protein
LQAGGQKQQQDQQPPPNQYSLQLLVPPGQLELGRRLITAMYSSSPDLSDLEAPQLMQLAALAECYGVSKVVAAVGSHFQLETMSLHTAAALLGLPDACFASEAFSKVQQAAADKLQQELGDLEVAWADKDKWVQLMLLPFGALLQLLRDKRTRAASEDTAVCTAQYWLRCNPAPTDNQQEQQQQQQQEQQQQLAGVLRPPHCMATFLASLAGCRTMFEVDTSWVYGSSPVVLVDLLALSSASRRRWEHHLESEYVDKPAWHLPPRPASAATQVRKSWHLPLAELQQLFEDSRQPDAKPCQADSATSHWCGRHWYVSITVDATGTGASIRLHCRPAPAYVHGALGAAPIKGDPPNGWYKFDGLYVTNRGLGGASLEWGAHREEWPAVKAWLSEQGLVHPDGCLHAVVTGVT